MKYRYFFFLALCLACVSNAWSQGIMVNAANNGQTFVYNPMAPSAIIDDGDSSAIAPNYSLNIDYSLHVRNDTGCRGDLVFCLALEHLDIAPWDTLFIYDGPSTSSPLICAINDSLNARLLYHNIYPSPRNTSRTLTVRFKTAASSSGVHTGFSLRTTCGIPCEDMVPIIDSMYYRTVNVVIVDSSYWIDAYSYDTVPYVLPTGDTIDSLMVVDSVKCLPLCLGQGIIFRAHADVTHDWGYQDFNDDNIMFKWSFGNGEVLDQVGAHTVPFDNYTQLDCYDVQLRLQDPNNQDCYSPTFSRVQVRLAQNPIKTIFSLPTICTGDSLFVNVGFEGDNAQLTLKLISFSRTESKSNDTKTFIPDGKYCDDPCFKAPVTFSEFPNGRTIMSSQDICSICVNYEHSYMGDYRLSIICPTGQEAALKWGNKGTGDNADPSCPEDAAAKACGGGSTYTGVPYGGASDSPWDGGTDQHCDSIYNMFGDGFEYCFSRNAEYTLVDGTHADVPAFRADVNTYISASGFTEQMTDYHFRTVPAPYEKAGQTASNSTFSTKRPSNHDGKSDYYTPASDFSELVGCPLNGEWNIQICDFWQSDNGWVFSWSMDICNISAGGGCEYQVAIDSVSWAPDPVRGKGLTMHPTSLSSAYLMSIDTAVNRGVIDLAIFDEFGCRWDTITHLTTVWVPRPNLGADTVLCDVQTTVLNAADSYAPTNNYTYVWEPFGQNTPTITTKQNAGKSINYTVEVTNTNPEGFVCYGRDTISIINSIQPIPNFDPGFYPLEGCEPLTIHFNNTSVHGDKYRWEFGDGSVSDLKDPSHTFSSGVYDFKFYVYNEGGCVDSLIYPNLIAVYPSPTAAFSWDPVYPSSTNPVIHLLNQTNPLLPTNKYFWEVQYDKDNPYSFHTVTDENPIFEWQTYGKDIAAPYTVRLIAQSENIPPSGTPLYCADTMETTIMILNDFLQFPTLVTPNGDGVNDRFVIKNLVNGLAYPVNTLDIYNKWGTQVYHFDNISRDEDFWDPINVPVGTYYYRFVGHGYNGNVEHNGVIEVVK